MQEHVTWGACAKVTPQERLNGTTYHAVASKLSCVCDILLRCTNEGGSLLGVPGSIADLLGATSQVHTQEMLHINSESEFTTGHINNAMQWTRMSPPWLQVSCVSDKEKEATLRLRAMDEASLSLAVDTVLAGVPSGVTTKVVRGGMDKEAARVSAAVEALLAELDFGVDTHGGLSEVNPSKWLQLQAQSDQAAAVLLQS
jgi:hypothetical protein